MKTFGSYFQPYARAPEVSDELFHQIEHGSAEYTVSYRYHPLQGSVVSVERCTFSSLQDFLCVELGKAILCGNTPRQCRLCGGWFLHEQGDRAMYCERIAPGETEHTCREAVARVVFEKKIQDEDAWKLYKWAHKKYYARYMKGNMSKDEFKTWAERAALDRDASIAQIEAAAEKARVTDWLKETLNQKEWTAQSRIALGGFCCGSD